MKITFEGGYPLIVSAAATVATHWLSDATKLAMAVQLAGPIVSITAITTGFLAAAMTVLLTAQDVGPIQRLRTSDAFRGLVNYHWSAISVALVAAVLSLSVNLAFPATATVQGTSPASWGLFHVWFFLVAMSLMNFYRVVRLLKLLLCPPSIA